MVVQEKVRRFRLAGWAVLTATALVSASQAEPAKLTEIIGRQFRVQYYGHPCDLVPLPHPSGASPWHRIEPGKTLLDQALRLIAAHPAWPHR